MTAPGRALAAILGYGRAEWAAPALWRNRVAEGPDRERIRLDQSLMARIAGGDESAFASVVSDTTPRLLRFLRSLLPDSPAEAEEVAQESLFRLWRHAAAWRPEGKIATWLHQVAYRLAIDAIRRRKPSVGIEAVADDLADEGPAPEQRLISAEDREALRAAIAALPERQRTALVLCHYEEMSQAEAASVMEIGERAYESLLARARRGLRKLLAGAPEGGANDR